MKTVIHEAAPSEGLVQRCIRCGEVLSDYRGVMSTGSWSPHWWVGFVEKTETGPGRTQTVGVNGPATCVDRRGDAEL